MTLEDRTVAVLGLGLIGGSIARDFAERGVHVAGFDADTPTLDAACAAGVVRTRLDGDLTGIESDDRTIIVIATPVSAMRQLLGASTRFAHSALVMDVASTKRAPLAAATAAGIAERFVGSHPMAGDHRSGWSASRRGLFSGCVVYLCPAPDARAESVELAREFWATLGSRTQIIEATEHDERVAFTSHVPHIASAAMAIALAKAGRGPGELGPGGRDALRLAGSSPELWSAITAENSEAILKALSQVEAELAAFRRALEAGDEAALRSMFSAARAWTK